MRLHGNYLIFIICVLGLLLSICSGYELNEFFKELLKLHNKARANHDSSELLFNPDLSSYSVELVKHYDLAKDCTWTICDDICFLFYKSKDIVNETAENVFLSWYNQGTNYNYLIEPPNNDTAHFTQIVWDDTINLGLALIENGDETLIVATYYPAGNQKGMYTYNVKMLNKKID